MSILFALLSYFGWGVGDIFGTISLRKIGIYTNAFGSLLIGLIIFSFYIPFELGNLHYSINSLIINLVMAMVWIVGYLLFNEAFKVGSAPLMGTITSSYAMFTLLFSIIFLKESITPPQIVFALLIFVGIILSSINIKEILNSKISISKGVLPALGAAILFGSYFAFIKPVIKEVGWFWPYYITLLFAPLILIFMYFKKEKLTKIDSMAKFLPLFIGSILLRIADVSFNVALGQGLTAVVAPIAGSYPTLFVVLAFFIFKDSITKQQIAGIITTLTGIVLLSIFSV